MHQKKFPYPLLILGIIFLGLTIYSMFHFPPFFTFPFFNLSIPLFPFVLGTFTLSVFCTVAFATRSFFHGVLFGSCALAYLLLRLAGLTSLFFLILLLAFCITMELFFLNKK